MPKKTKQRGGRKPGVWTLVTAEQIRSYRKVHNMSRASLAERLSVSSTTVQNWESGKGAASAPIQERIHALLGGKPAQTAPRLPSIQSTTNGRSGGVDAIHATGQILVAYLAGAQVELGQVGGLVRQVRAALA